MMGWGNGKVCVTTRLLGSAFLVFAGAAGALSRPAVAESVSPLEKSMNAVPSAAGSEKYDGVVPGPNAKNPLPSAPADGPYLVWTGFQMTAGGSRVFLQTTQSVQFDVKDGRATKSGKSTLEIKLRGCRIHMANNRRKIDTRFFATPVSNVSARQKRGDVEVHIGLREAVSVVPRNEVGPDGSQFLVLDFPPGKATPEPAAPRDMAAGQGDSDFTRDQDSGDPDALPHKGKKSQSKSAR
jgi:hypothetical protein